MLTEGADRLLFGSPETPTQSRIRIALLSGLFLFGAVWWLRFFDFGRASLNEYDWVKESAYLRVLAEAVGAGQIPWYWNWYYAHGTQNFLGNPEIVLTPDVVLLRWIAPPVFVLCHTVLCYAAGFLGMVLLARRFRIGLIGIAYFFVLFNFNGYITAHMAVGHWQWTGYFLLPLYFSLILRLTSSGRPALTDSYAVAAVIGLLFLNGSFHIAIWCLLFVALMGVFRWDLVPVCLRIFLGATSLAACRWVPGFFSLSDHHPSFLFGYPSLPTLFDALTGGLPTGLGETTPVTARHAWWEYDVHVGVVGLAFLLLACVVFIWRRQKPFDRSVIAAAAVLFVLSLGNVWSLVSRLDVPLLGVERVSTRFIVMPLMIGLIALMAGMEEWTIVAGRAAKAVMLIGLPLAAYELLVHAEQWRLAVAGVTGFGVADAKLLSVTELDRSYAMAVYGSWTVSVIAWLLIGRTLLRQRMIPSGSRMATSPK